MDPSAASAQPAPPAHRPSILLVGDSEGTIDLLARQLRGEGLRVMVARSAEEALAVCEAERPHVLVADHRMPRVNGLELLRRARELSPLTLRVLMSAHADVHAIETALSELLVHGLLPKPWERHTLLTVVRAAVAQAQLLAENARLAQLAGEQHRSLRELQRTLDEMVGERTAILARGKRQWERTFDAITDPLMLLDRDYKVIRANVSMAREYRLPIADLVGKRCWELRAQLEDSFQPGKDGKCRGCPVARALSGQPETSEIEALSGRSFRISAYPIASGESGAGAPEWIACTYRDTTDERSRQRQFAQADKLAAIGRLAAGVAHEINNPLAGVLAFTQILRLGGNVPDPEAQSYLSEIEQGALRCKKIVDSLLHFSRQGRREEKRDVSLTDVVGETLLLVERQFGAARVVVERDLDENIARVYANPAQIQQVLLNLLTNAFDAMPDGGSIRIHTGAENGYAEVVVTDTGCGIEPPHLSQIFEPFFTTKGSRGAGLGLAVSFGILKEHRGGIEISSRVGEGTSARVWIPVLGRSTTKLPSSAARTRVREGDND